MISIHAQNSVPNWLDIIRALKDGSWYKLVFGVERSAEIAAVAASQGKKINILYRAVLDQPLPMGVRGEGYSVHDIRNNEFVNYSDFGPGSKKERTELLNVRSAEALPTYETYKAHARAWLVRFVDGTFYRYAKHISAINGYNETLANSQTPLEKQAWLMMHTALMEVWATEFRTQPELAHIRLAAMATAVGNDIPVEFARAAMKWDAIVDYHPYIFFDQPGHIHNEDWRWWSGRWHYMDAEYRKHGVVVEWIFGEGGPFATAVDGWRSSKVCGGDVNKLYATMEYWCKEVVGTPAYKEGRVYGCMLFTSGGPGSQWKWFEIDAGTAVKLAELSHKYPVQKPPEPPVEPPQTGDGLPRVDYARTVIVVPQDASEALWEHVCAEAYANKQTVGFSYDDAGIGKLSKKTAVLYNIPVSQQGEFIDWYARNYPGTQVVFRDFF